ncbi:hypothetical protein RRG08_003379 [Elysia crispata]|uniref:Glycoprotein hormone alpha 2 n=1 Tax=Elysia crispata TaxID=231223 RepID=A0AAE1ACL7_9GAST|nr:hypothetical protein RRG08_003379 [Elysia crispata]
MTTGDNFPLLRFPAIALYLRGKPTASIVCAAVFHLLPRRRGTLQQHNPKPSLASTHLAQARHSHLTDMRQSAGSRPCHVQHNLPVLGCRRLQMSTESLRIVILLLLLCGHSSLWGHVEGRGNGTRPAWEAPGCHLVGNNRMVRIPGCVAFEMATNACRGYCVSYAIPSPAHTTEFNTNFIITSRAACCGIVDAFDTKVRVLCRDGYREFTFKSASSCACSICRSKH